MLKNKMIAITGSNGKPLPKILSMLFYRRLFKRKTLGNYNNHIGLPFTILNLEEKMNLLYWKWE